MAHALFIKPLIGARAMLLKHAPAYEHLVKAPLVRWFDEAELELVEISWRDTPKPVLKKLMDYEAVHPMRSWEDLKNRLDSDRKIYAFFHKKMPLDPLIFVQVAFTKGMGSSIQHVLDTSLPTLDVAEADTATFYSISNAQAGLKGISFGNFLIKRVVAELSETYPHIQTYATLSPIPGFAPWLRRLLQSETDLVDANQRVQLAELERCEWTADASLCKKIRPILMGLCAHYLLHEKHGAKPLDPVANFHLYNGAQIAQLHWLADISEKGLAQSYGLMVNYHYKLDELEQNHRAFETSGKIVASNAIHGYL